MLEFLFNKVAGMKASNFIKKALLQCFPVNIAKILRRVFLLNTSGLVLDIEISEKYSQVFVLPISLKISQVNSGHHRVTNLIDNVPTSFGSGCSEVGRFSILLVFVLTCESF